MCDKRFLLVLSATLLAFQCNAHVISHVLFITLFFICLMKRHDDLDRSEQNALGHLTKSSVDHELEHM